MNQFSKYVGLDVHKETIAVAVADAHGGELRFVGEIVNTPQAILKLVRQLSKAGAQLSFCYEAGPCGYGIHRQLIELGSACQVVAPSLIPRKPGDRVKTDRRDALSLAREDMKHLQLQSKQRLLAFLLRHGKRFSGRCNWTKAHHRWMQEVKFEQPTQYIVMQEYIDTVLALSKRLKTFDEHIGGAWQAQGASQHGRRS
jgi:transposase